MIHIPPHIIVEILAYAAMLKLAMAKEIGLSPFQFLTLSLVGSTKQTSIKELKQRLSIPGSSLTFTIDSLEKKKLIRRQRSKEDRRQWFISLSPQGQDLYSEIVRKEGEAILPTLRKLSEDERAVFTSLAQDIINPGKANNRINEIANI